MTPTPEQTLLLRACLLSGSAAASAWQQWRERVNFDDIDGGSYRLVPLAYKNLQREKIEDEILGRLKGIYRHTWARNQLLFHDAAQVMKAMQEAGIPVLVLKGATLASTAYTDAGLRPMNDFDFMVPFGETRSAFEIMSQSGWKYVESVPLEQTIWSSHASKWNNQGGRQIDLHWHLLPGWRLPEVDEGVVQRAAKIQIAGTTFPAMSATDLLWHVCAHGAIGDEVPSIRWVADAWMILHDDKRPVDWELFLDSVQQRSLGFSVSRALHFLKTEFNAPVPDRVLEILARAPISRLERWEQHIISRPRGVLGALPLHCVNYIRQTQHDSLWGKVSGVPLFFRRTWGVPDTRGLLKYALKKARNRLRQKDS
jgi:hypothetical protein